MILKVAFYLMPFAASIATLQMMPVNALAQSVGPDAQTVNLTVADSSLSYVVYEIARQSGMKVVGSHSEQLTPILKSRKVAVQLKNASVQDAYKAVLKGTDLVAKISRNGETVAIRKRDAKESVQDSVQSKAPGKVTGRVIDSTDNKVVSGATVMVIGQNISVSTDAGGSFVLSGLRPGKVVISVRMLGYMTRQIEVNVVEGKEVPMTFMLNPTVNSLNQVVTTATGAQRRVEIPNDIVRINADEIRERAPIRSAVDLIDAAQVPGVLVTRGGGDPGAPSRIRIRGIGSISENNDPVIIMDGVWIDMTSTRLNDIDPAAIETIEIVRGPSAATLYGQDAANGVIVITSKRGTRGPAKWTLSYARDWGETYGRKPMVYTGFGATPLTTSVIRCPIRALLDYSCSQQDSIVVSDPNHYLLSQEGVETVNRYSARMEGGTSDVNYSITFSNNTTTGVRRVAPVDLIRYRTLSYSIDDQLMKPSQRTQNSITTALRFLPKPRLSMNLTLTGTQASLKNNKVGPNAGNRWASMVASKVASELNIDTALINGSSITIPAVVAPENSFNGLIAAAIQYTPGMFVVNGNIGYERSERNNSMFERNTYCQVIDGGKSGECRDTLGRGNKNSSSGKVYTARTNVSTVLNLGRFSNIVDIRPSIGGDFKRQSEMRFALSKDRIPIGDNTLNSGTLVTSQDAVLNNALAGWYINSTVGLLKRIYFDIGLRQDIGSAITSSKNTKYPKLGGSWVVSEEPFWKENRIVNSLRLRSAVGHAAVQPTISDINGKYINGMEFIDGKYRRTADLNGTGNSTLQPERAVEFELGFDSDLLNDRVNLIATYAQKANKNTMISRDLPPSLGGSRRKENVARVQNKNLEVSATARAIETKDILFILSYAATLSDNVVKSLGPNVIFGNSSSSSRIEKGYPIAGAWKRRVMGYRDINEDGIISPDELLLSDSIEYIGWTQPRNRATYGLSLTLKNLLTFDGRFESQSKYVQNYQVANSRGAEDHSSSYDEQALSAIETGSSARPVSHVRWNSASVTYHLPNPILRRIGGRAFSVSLQGRNLGLWSNYIGRDPGINSAASSQEEFADNGNTPPPPRLYVLDFKIGF